MASGLLVDTIWNSETTPVPKHIQGSVTQESGSEARLPGFKSRLLSPLAIWPPARVFLHSFDCKMQIRKHLLCEIVRIKWDDTIKSLEWAQKVIVTQLCPTLYDSMDCSLLDSSVHEILQVRILVCGLPCPTPGDLPDPGIEPRSPALQADSLSSEPPRKPISEWAQRKPQ